MKIASIAKVKRKRISLKERLANEREAGRIAGWDQCRNSNLERDAGQKHVDREMQLKLLETDRQAIQAIAQCATALSVMFGERYRR